MEDIWKYLLRNDLVYSTSAVSAALLFLAILVAGRICCALITRMTSTCNEISIKLPPGNLGLPLIGETVDFIRTVSCN